MIARMCAFGPKLWYEYHFEASKLWEGVEVNSLGVSIIWGSMFAHYDTRQAWAGIQRPIFLAPTRYDYFYSPGLCWRYRDCGADLTIRVFENSGHTTQP